ncbi:MAG: glycosyltransferase [Candidatus Riflebacteria bacterium]|nr:glycosyltransferase [Candidatus Riflebacteria bacterium]
MKPLLISFIIPAFNEEKLLPQTIAAIKKASEVFHKLRWKTELIVTDNNSTDNTAAIARNCGAQVVFEPLNGIARARNKGAAAAHGDWLIFIDADSIPSEALFRDVSRAIHSNQVLGGGSTLNFDFKNLFGICSSHIWNAISRLFKFAAGSFIFCEASSFRELKGFNDTMYAAEEINFSRRLYSLARQRGKSVVILSKNPMMTSGRKLKFHSSWEVTCLLLRFLLRLPIAIHSRAACDFWYDGRR